MLLKLLILNEMYASDARFQYSLYYVMLTAMKHMFIDFISTIHTGLSIDDFNIIFVVSIIDI